MGYDWTGDRVKVHRIELLVIDHDDLGADEVKVEIENVRYPNRCISPEVMGIETREMDWADDHPMNLIDQQENAFRVLFGHGGDVDGECCKRLPGLGVKCQEPEGHSGLHKATWMRGDARVTWKDDDDEG